MQLTTLLLAHLLLAAVSPIDLSLTDLKGQKAHLHDFRGKPIVLNFWATWCGPCREEMPLLIDAESRWRARGVVFIAASLDDRKTKPAVPNFVDQFHIPFPVWTGATLTDLARLHMGNGVPDTVFIDPDGAIFSRVKGEISREELEERLVWVTGDRKTPPPSPLLNHLQ